MKKDTIFDTRWFSLSGRELLVLSMAVALVLGAVGAVAGIRALFERPGLTVTQRADMAPQPARLNINVARESELTLLPGIGPKTARAIVEYRRTHGPFPTLDALKNVPGLGPKTVERLRPYAMCAPLERTAE